MMKLGTWSNINWRRVWLAVLIGFVVLVATCGLWGWWLEGLLTK